MLKIIDVSSATSNVFSTIIVGVLNYNSRLIIEININNILIRCTAEINLISKLIY